MLLIITKCSYTVIQTRIYKQIFGDSKAYAFAFSIHNWLQYEKVHSCVHMLCIGHGSISAQIGSNMMMMMLLTERKIFPMLLYAVSVGSTWWNGDLNCWKQMKFKSFELMLQLWFMRVLTSTPLYSLSTLITYFVRPICIKKCSTATHKLKAKILKALYLLFITHAIM
jgi:hypothetical protein